MRRAVCLKLPEVIRVILIILLMGVGIDVPPESSAGVADQPDAAETSTARIDEILTKLEEQSAKLKDIRCRIRFEEDDRINLSKRVKFGSILCRMADPNPHFLVHFEKTEVDGMLGKQEWYLFDGRWLYEAIERIQQVTKREIASEGEKLPLFDIEKAPFPLPFGQKKEEILRHFDVTLVPPAPGDPKGTDHLVCVPKEDSNLNRRFARLEFFILRDLHLPNRLIVTKPNGLEINTADFPDLGPESTNRGVSESDFRRPAAWKKYKEVVEASQ